MGLDAFELVAAVEDRFDIAVPDDEWQIVFGTFGDLHRYVLGRTGVSEERRAETCPTLARYLAVRAVLVGELGVDRRAVRPDAKLRRLIPRRHRRRVWEALDAVPDLHPRPLRPRPPAAVLNLSLTGGRSITRPIRRWVTRFPWGLVTVADLVRTGTPADLARRWREMPDDPGRAAAVRDALVEIVTDVLGVDPADVTPDARFGRELPLD